MRRGAVGAAVVSTVATNPAARDRAGRHRACPRWRRPRAARLRGPGPLLFAAVLARRAVLARHRCRTRPAFDLKTLVLLADIVSLVLVVAAALNNALGAKGVTLGTAVAGLADPQSAASPPPTLWPAGAHGRRSRSSRRWSLSRPTRSARPSSPTGSASAAMRSRSGSASASSWARRVGAWAFSTPSYAP